jgi:hypothetical protein
MELIMSFTDQAGVVHEQACVQIERIIADLAGEPTLSMDVCIYHSREKRDAGNGPVWGPQGYTFSLLGDAVGLSILNNAVPASYHLLQSLDKFQAGAITE